mmetsp:Transcript_136830/g.255590  ORF Transcript_136830/g.255590 Transcript_136830/m.255590 type:complete len:91 (-) Transcript_136830:187-459(-)
MRDGKVLRILCAGTADEDRLTPEDVCDWELDDHSVAPTDRLPDNPPMVSAVVDDDNTDASEALRLILPRRLGELGRGLSCGFSPRFFRGV